LLKVRGNTALRGMAITLASFRLAPAAASPTEPGLQANWYFPPTRVLNGISTGLGQSYGISAYRSP